MPTILTSQEAAHFVRTDADDPILQQWLPLVDQYLANATGHDWAQDTPVHPTAVAAAGILLVYWYDNPQEIGQSPAALAAALVQLEAESLKYRKYRFYGNNGAGGIAVSGAQVGDVVQKLVGVYGVSGDQTAPFETVVSVDNQLQQVSSADLSGNQYVVVVKHPAEDVAV